MVGFRTPDDTVFLADCLSSEQTLAKYGVPFIFDVGAYLATLEMVEGLQANMFVPAHAEATDTIAPLARLNRQKTLETAELITSLCQTPVPFETVLQGVFTHYGLTMSMAQYVLVGSTVRSFLSWLLDKGALTSSFDNNLMLWHKA